MNPRDPEVRQIEVGYQTGRLNKVQKDAIKSLRTKNAYINAILGYGETIEAYVKQHPEVAWTLLEVLVKRLRAAEAAAGGAGRAPRRRPWRRGD